MTEKYGYKKTYKHNIKYHVFAPMGRFQLELIITLNNQLLQNCCPDIFFQTLIRHFFKIKSVA